MSRIVRISVLGILLLAVTSSASLAQVAQGGPATRFLEAHPQPRVHALGKATAALRGYAGAIDINPATIGEQGIVRFGTNVGLHEGPIVSSDWLPNSSLSSDFWISSVGGSIRQGPWTGALQWKHFSLGTIKIRNSEGENLGEFYAYETAVTVAGAYDLSDAFTLGGATRVIRSKLSDNKLSDIGKGNATAVAIDLGIHYRRSFDTDPVLVKPLLGWSLKNFGPNIDYDQSNPSDQALPMTMRLGGGLQVASRKTWRDRPVVQLGLYGALSTLLWNTRKVVENGDTYYEADGPFRTLFSSGWTPARQEQGFSGDVDRLSVWDQTIRHAGIEITVYDILSLQWGRFHEDENATEAVNPRQLTNFGFGLEFDYVRLEHSWTVGDGQYNNSFWRLTGRIPLNGDGLSFWPSVLD